MAEFLTELNMKQREKVARAIDLLKAYGSLLRFPEADTIKGKKYDGLMELRVNFSSDIFRIFYYFASENKAVLLHGIAKKQNRTPIKELDIALQRMNDHMWRTKDGMGRI